MSTPFKTFQAKFRTTDLLIHESEYWCWSLRPVQCTLAAGVLSLKRPALKMAEVSAAEMTDLHTLMVLIEQRTAMVFKHQILNYLALMMVDHQVHFHVIPRYDKSQRFAQVQWRDSGWPALPELADNPLVHLSSSDQEAVYTTIMGALRRL